MCSSGPGEIAMASSIEFQYYDSPCGEMIIGSYEEQLCLCDWRYRKMRLKIDYRISTGLNTSFVQKNSTVITQTIHQLNCYFNKGLHYFAIPILEVGTPFQKQVWKHLKEIPYGETWSYTELAQRMLNPLGIRAIASANGANAISIIIPCHRIIGSDGDLVGYAGGLRAKKQLLQLEGALNIQQLRLL